MKLKDIHINELVSIQLLFVQKHRGAFGFIVIVLKKIIWFEQRANYRKI
jgi:hypothetical protein